MLPHLPASPLPDLRLVEVVGEGGMGRVERCWDPMLQREVARKVHLRGSLARFLAEAQILALLDHPGVPALYDIAEDGLSFTMELLEGRSMAEAMRDLGAAGDGRALQRVLRQIGAVADILAHAHAAGVVHRDVKASNVLLGPAGEVWLVDWGIATQRGLAEDGNHMLVGEGLTQLGERIGTPAWMSPEQARGEPCSGPADVWAVGALLHLALVGELPFPTEPLEHLQGPGPLPDPQARAGSAGRPPIRSDLLLILLRCLAWDPQQRYPDARSLARDLGSWLDGAAARAVAQQRATRARQELEVVEGRLSACEAALEEARAAVEGLQLATPPEEHEAAWERLIAAEQAMVQASRADEEALEALRAAVGLDPDLEDPRAQLADWHERWARRAEARAEVALARRHLAARDHWSPVRRSDLAELVSGLPEDAELRPVIMEGLIWREGPARPHPPGPLEPGSWVLRWRGATWPLWLERGERRSLTLEPPPPLPPGFLYIPAGPALLGGAPSTGEAPRFRHLPAYTIQRRPLSWAEYQAGLQLLIDAGEDPTPLLPVPGAVALRWEGGALRLEPEQGPQGATASLPASQLHLRQVLTVATAWGRRLGLELRLPTPQEWEKAGRGADGRPYPWGRAPYPPLANILESSQALEPAELRPWDRSVHGAESMAGGLRELCAQPDGSYVIKGGAWYAAVEIAHLAPAWPISPDHANPRLGFRLCASLGTR